MDDNLKSLLKHLDDQQASNISFFDIKLSALADVMIIVTARSNVHARSLGYSVKKYLKKISKNVSVEGVEQGEWVLVDSPWVMVHILQEAARDYYDLDNLWPTTIPFLDHES